MTEESTPTPYEEPKIADYGDLAEITAARSATPPHIDGNYSLNQEVNDPFSVVTK